MKPEFKKQAIELRRQGFSYGEILDEVPVARSTLSLWLRDIPLSKKQKKRLARKKIEAAQIGAKTRKENRIRHTKTIKEKASSEIGKLTRRELQLFGTALYWAEGAKEKENNVSAQLKFANSDPNMIRFYLAWLSDVLGVSGDKLILSLYIHKTSKYRLQSVLKYWESIVGEYKDKVNYVYFKKHKLHTTRKNVGNNYFGMMSVKVKRSTDINRKVAGWIEGVINGINY